MKVLQVTESQLFDVEGTQTRAQPGTSAGAQSPTTVNPYEVRARNEPLTAKDNSQRSHFLDSRILSSSNEVEGTQRAVCSSVL